MFHQLFDRCRIRSGNIRERGSRIRDKMFGEGGSISVLVRMCKELSDRINGLVLVGRLPDLLIRFSMRSLMSCPASGAAVTIVPDDALGGGIGLFVRNKGCMWSSLGALEREPGLECETVPELEPGREKLRWRGGLVGGGQDGGGNMVEKFGNSDGLEWGELGLETVGCGNGLAGGLNDGLG